MKSVFLNLLLLRRRWSNRELRLRIERAIFECFSSRHPAAEADLMLSDEGCEVRSDAEGTCLSDDVVNTLTALDVRGRAGCVMGRASPSVCER